MSQTGNGAINRILNSVTIFGFSHLNEHGLVILKMHALQTEWKAKANQALPKKKQHLTTCLHQSITAVPWTTQRAVLD